MTHNYTTHITAQVKSNTEKQVFGGSWVNISAKRLIAYKNPIEINFENATLHRGVVGGISICTYEKRALMVPFSTISQQKEIMNSNYTTHITAQVKSNIIAYDFDVSNVENAPSELNYHQKSSKMLSIASRTLKGCPPITPIIFTFLQQKADNLTGESRYGLDSMVAALGYSRRHIIDGIKILRKRNLIIVKRRGRMLTNKYWINYSLIGEPIQVYKKCTNRPTVYRQNYGKILPRLEVHTECTQSTNKTKKEVSINTYIESNTNFSIEPKLEVEVLPVEITDDWIPTQRTQINVRTKLGHLDYHFVDLCVLGFKAHMIPKGKTYLPEAWQRLFYRYCERSWHDKQKFGTWWIPHHKRLDFKQKKPANPLINNAFTTNEAIKPVKKSENMGAIKYDPIDFGVHSKWSKEDEDEMDLDLKAFYAKHAINNKKAARDYGTKTIDTQETDACGPTFSDT